MEERLEVVGAAGSGCEYLMRDLGRLAVGLDLKLAAIALNCQVSAVARSPQSCYLLIHRALRNS